MEQMSKTRRILLTLCIIVMGISFSGIFSILYCHFNSLLDPSHVYICEDKETDEFYQWLKTNLELNWVPSYIIIKDKKVVGKFNGDISLVIFKDLVKDKTYDEELPTYTITNIDGQSTTLKDLIKDDELYILEVHWIDCPDCIHQDENFTRQIYFSYKPERFFRYYVNSDLEKIKEKYEN